MSYAWRLGLLILKKSSKVVTDILLSKDRIYFLEKPFGVFMTAFGVGFIGEGVKFVEGLAFLVSSI